VVTEVALTDTQKAILAKLRERFAPEVLEKKPKLNCRACSDSKTKNCDKHQKTVCRTCKAYISTKHIHLDYVGHARVTDRLLENDPLWNWEPMARHADGTPVLDDNGGMWIQLTIAGITRIGYGHADGKRGGDAVKETIGDAIRNAALRFGVALELWMKEAGGVDDVPEKPVERPAQTPKQRCNELRGQIRALGKVHALDVVALGDRFAEWSRGGQILAEENPDTLAEFLNFLRSDLDA
jgi:hypothetical protein